MSFTTRCPACGTLFRVVADQLKISDGWVRCGHCSDVFDATVHLAPWTPPSPAASPAGATHAPEPPARGSAASTPEPGQTPAPEPAPEQAPEPASAPEPLPKPMPAPTPVPSSAAVPDDDDLHAWFGEGPLDGPAAGAAAPVAPAPVPAPMSRPEPAPQPAPRVAVTPPAVPETADANADSDEGPSSEFEAELHRFVQSARELAPAPDIARRPTDTDADAGPPSSAPDAARAGDRRAPSQAPDDDHEPAVPGFVRQAQRQAYWSSPGMRVLLVLVAVLAALLLAGQWALQHRHDLAARYPQARPWIAQACTYLGCDLAPVQRIEAVEIESAQLVRRLGNFYSFDFVLRNRAAVEVALPALELTLTNTLDRPVVRRVFLPGDWPDAPAALPPQGTVSVSLRLSISLDDAAPTAGYRALVFYP